MKSAVAALLVITFFIATSMAQDVPLSSAVDGTENQQIDYKAELNKLKEQFSGKFAQLQKQVAENVEQIKSGNVPEEVKAKLENMKNEVGTFTIAPAVFENVKAKFASMFNKQA